MAYGTDYASSGYDRTITAVFDRREDATRAMDKLVSAGIPRDRISMMDGGDGASATQQQGDGGGFWESLADFFFPDEDRSTYAEGLRRGGQMVTVRTDTAHYDQALDIMDDEGAVDLDEREQSWRSEGWTGYEGRSDLAETEYERPTPSSAAGVGTMSNQTMQDMESGGDTIPIAEERLRIGKRDVSHGRVRVRSYVVEEPVSESVDLHDERVEVERRPVDRQATSGDGLWRDKTIEAEEYAEEPVVTKVTRVTEEIGLRKEADDRTETVSDKVRHTEVDIEDERSERDPQRR